eukprot:gene21311-13362_t
MAHPPLIDGEGVDGSASPSAFTAAGVLIDRAVGLHGAALVHSKSVHRLLLAAFVIAAKLRDDVYRRTSCYARQELCSLERAFLDIVGWELAVSIDDCNRFAARARRRRPPPPPPPPPPPHGALPFAVGSPPRRCCRCSWALSASPDAALSSPHSTANGLSCSPPSSPPSSHAASPPAAARRPRQQAECDLRAKLASAAALHAKLRALPPSLRLDSDLRTAAAKVAHATTQRPRTPSAPGYTALGAPSWYILFGVPPPVPQRWAAHPPRLARSACPTPADVPAPSATQPVALLRNAACRLMGARSAPPDRPAPADAHLSRGTRAHG